MNLDQLRKFSKEIECIAAKHGIATIYLFGSTARGETKKSSDVDFLVELEENASLFGVAGFQYECEKLLGMKVDVVPLSVLDEIKDQAFSKHVRQDAVLL